MGICGDNRKKKEKENENNSSSRKSNEETNLNNLSNDKENNNMNITKITSNEKDNKNQISYNKNNINDKKEGNTKDINNFKNINHEINQGSSTIQNNSNIFKTEKKITSGKSDNIDEINEKKDETKINIIYLLDMTKSMKKYRDIIYSIKDVNISMKKKYSNIKFGYVLYRDFENDNFQNKLGIYNHIEIIQLNSNDVLPESKIKFEKGEDWANAYYAVSQIDFNGVKENIIIHICDAGAHSNCFSDYDEHNEQEYLLKMALKECNKKKLKIIGFLYNNFSRKSFVQCQNYYYGYYDVVDLACSGKEFNKEIIQEKIQKALKNENIFKIDNYTDINGFENDFIYKDEKVSMHNPNVLPFLPDLENKTNLVYLIEKKRAGIMQGDLGDCYLISSILSIIFSNMPIVNYFFPESKEYTQNSKIIRMLIFENGIRKEIYFNNTYPFNQYNQYIFGKPMDNAFFNICIERGYATYYSDKKRYGNKPKELSIISGYENIIGGFQYNVFNFLFGCISEYYNFYKISNIQDKEKKISKENLKNKIIKYIDNKGLISCWVYFNILRKDSKGNYEVSGHAYSVIGYKQKNDITYIEVLNPWLKGGNYLKQNIQKNDIYNNLKKKNDKESKKQIEELDKQEISMNIYEDEFDYGELKDKFLDYSNTGYLIMKCDTFYKWISGISFCDPMIGSYERIYEIYPSETMSINFSLRESSKIKAYLIDVNEKLNDDEQKQNFNILLNNNTKYKLILNKNSPIIEKKGDLNNFYAKGDNNGIQEGINGLIYDYLSPNNYQIKIIPNDINNLDKYIYLKIQSDKALNNEFNINNGIIDFHPNYPHHYPNSPFNKGNYGGDNNVEYTHQMNPSRIIEKIVFYMLNIFDVLCKKEVKREYYDYHLIE